MAKDKVVVRNLPFWVTEDTIRQFLCSHPITKPLHEKASEPPYTLVKLKKGKPANKSKNRPPVLAWAILSLRNHFHCEKFAAALDGASITQADVSGNIQNTTSDSPVFVEYTPLQSNAVPAAKPAPDDTDCGNIFQDPSYLRFVAKLNHGITSAMPTNPRPNDAQPATSEPPVSQPERGDTVHSLIREADERAAERIAAGSCGNTKLIDHILKLWYVDDKKPTTGSSRRDRGGRNKGQADSDDHDQPLPSDETRKRKAKLRADDKVGKREKERNGKDDLLGGTMEEKLLRRQLKDDQKQKQKEEKQQLLDLIDRKRKERQDRRDAKAAIAALATATLKSTPSAATTTAPASSTTSKFTVTTTRQGVNKPPTATDLRNMPALALSDPSHVSHSDPENGNGHPVATLEESVVVKKSILKRKDRTTTSTEIADRQPPSSFVVTSTPPSSIAASSPICEEQNKGKDRSRDRRKAKAGASADGSAERGESKPVRNDTSNSATDICKDTGHTAPTTSANKSSRRGRLSSGNASIVETTSTTSQNSSTCPVEKNNSHRRRTKKDSSRNTDQ